MKLKILAKLNKEKNSIQNGIQFYKFTLYFSQKLRKFLGWDETTNLELKILSKGEVITAINDCVLMTKK